MCADPPSVEGTGGGQIAPEEWPAVAAVEAAAWEEVSGVSPGNCKGTCEVLDGEALMLDALPSTDGVGLPVVWPLKVVLPNGEPVGKVAAGTLSGSAPTLVAEPAPLRSAWAWASASPKTRAAANNIRHIAISCFLPPEVTREPGKRR